MKASLTLAPEQRRVIQKDLRIHFDEGLIGLSECKDFILAAREELFPFFVLQSTDRPEVEFLILDPSIVIKNYYDMLPARSWETVGLKDPAGLLAFVICSVGPTQHESSGNFVGPLILNPERLTGRQIILTDSDLSVRHPLI